MTDEKHECIVGIDLRGELISEGSPVPQGNEFRFCPDCGRELRPKETVCDHEWGAEERVGDNTWVTPCRKCPAIYTRHFMDHPPATT